MDHIVPTCIVCSKQMTNVTDVRKDGFQPDCGIAFHTHGHYGSTLFDPMDGSVLELCVCDDCVGHAARKQQVLRINKRPGKRQVIVYDPWNQED